MDKYTLFVLSTIVVTFLHCKPADNFLAHPAFPATDDNSIVLDTKDLMDRDSVNITASIKRYSAAGINTNPAVPQKKNWQRCTDSISIDELLATKDCWFSFSIQNNTPLPFKRILCVGDFEYAALYCSHYPTEKAGTLVPIDEWSYPGNKACLTLQLNGNQEKQFMLYYNKRNVEPGNPLRFILRTEQNENSYESLEMKWRMADTVFLFFYLGFLSFCFIYFLAQFTYRRQEHILVIYAFYILFTLLYSFRDVDKHYFLQTSFPLFNGINIWGEAIFSYLSYIFYLLFIIYLLNLKEKRKPIYILIVVMIGIMIMLFAADIILRFSGRHQLALKVFHDARGLLFPLTLLYFLLIIPLFRREYYQFFLWGTIFIGLGTGLNLLVHVLRFRPSYPFNDIISSRYGFWGNPVNYTRLGVIIEVIFFSLGLAKKLQVEYARSAVLNLSGNYTGIVFHEIKNGFNKLIGLIKAKSNDSIKFIHELNDVIADSLEINEAKISLADELDIAKRYFHFRVKPGREIELTIIVDPGIQVSNFIVPPLLLQPFIENCVKHAFPDDEKTIKQVKLHVTQKNNLVHIEVSDNGVGFTNTHFNNKSKGIQLARQRLQYFNEVFGTHIYFEAKNHSQTAGAIVKIYNLQKDSYDKSNIS